MLTALAVLGLTCVQAQDGDVSGFAKGDIFISGQFGYNSEKEGDRKNNTFTITPKLGYFISENIAIGPKLGYQSNSQEFAGGGELDINTFSLGAFGRYYFTPSTKFSLFGEFGVAYQSGKSDNGTTEITIDGFNLGGGPGISYFLNHNFALELFWGILEYSTLEPDNGGESIDNFNIGVGFDDLNLGLVYKF